MSVGNLLRQMRKSRGMSQQQLAAAIDVDMRRISFYENNKKTPSTEVLKRLSQFFDVSIDYLLAGEIQGVRKMSFQDKELFSLFQQADNFCDRDRDALKEVIKAFVIKNKIRDLSHLGD